MSARFKSWGQRVRLMGAVVLCAVLGACTLPKQSGPISADTYARVGRFAVTVESPVKPRQAVQGGFAWRDDGRKLQLDLANPLGTVLARVEADQQRAVLTRSDGSQTSAISPDALVAEVLGSAIPVSGLRHWLRGQQAQGQIDNLQRDNDGHLSLFVQDGWQVRLSRYDDQGPRLLRMNRQQAGESIDVRLVVD